MKQKKKKKIDIVRFLAVFAVIVAIIYFYLNIGLPHFIPKSLRIGVVRKPVNILIVGTDTTYNAETHKPMPNLKGRADTILLACVSPTRSQINILAIPRDTYVSIPQRGMNKINVANAYGGIDLMRQTVEDLTRQKIDHYIEVKPTIVPKIVDLLGGIEIDVEKNMCYVDRAQNLNINLKKGRQRLCGKDAHDYIRFRSDIEGDIGRIKRQQKFLKALIKTMIKPTNIIKAPRAIDALLKEVETDLSLSSITRMLNWMRAFSIENINAAMISGEVSYIEEVGSVWLLNEAAVEEQIVEFLE